MSKSILYKLFGLGKLSSQQKALIEKENCIAFDEGVRSSVNYKDFKAPGKSFKNKLEFCITSIVLTEKRLTVQRGNKNFLINLPFDDRRVKKVLIALDTDKSLTVSFDAKLFHDDWSGKIKFKLKTELAECISSKFAEIQTF